MLWQRFLASAVIFILCLAGCQTAQETGRSQFIVVSESQEKQLGVEKEAANLRDTAAQLRIEGEGLYQPLGRVKSVTDPIGPWTNYGPKPPAVGVNVSSDNWGAGENCLFMVSGGVQVPRTEMATPLCPVNGPLVKLSSSRLSDGPWCPDSSMANRFDADLLRVRKVRVTLRVQVGAKQLRGPTGTFFLRGGTATGGNRYIPDQEISFEVTPRNLNFGR
jgi:hypothetical protein